MLPDGKGNRVKNENYDPLKADRCRRKANSKQSLPVLRYVERARYYKTEDRSSNRRRTWKSKTVCMKV